MVTTIIKLVKDILLTLLFFFTRMNNAANLLNGSGANIDEFVKRSTNLKIVQKQLPRYKLKFSDIQHIRNIVIENKFEMKKEDVSAIIDTQNVQKRLEQTIMSAEELAERNQEKYDLDFAYKTIILN